MGKALLLLAGVLLCFGGALAGTVTIQPHPGFEKYAVLLGISLMIIATIWAFADPASWAVR